MNRHDHIHSRTHRCIYGYGYTLAFNKNIVPIDIFEQMKMVHSSVFYPSIFFFLLINCIEMSDRRAKFMVQREMHK